MSKVKCKLCQRKILPKTARKYQGYSRQCLAKLRDFPAGSFEKETVKEKKISKKLKYSRQEFNNIWVIPADDSSRYENFYQNNQFIHGLTTTRLLAKI